MHLGVTWVPVNTEFRGEQLVRAFNQIHASTIFIDLEFCEIVESILPSVPDLKTVVVHDLHKTYTINCVNIYPSC